MADCVVQVRRVREGKDWPDAWKPKDRTYEVTLRDEWFEKPVHVLRARTQVVFSNHSPEHCNLHGYLQPDPRALTRRDTVFNFGLGANVVRRIVEQAYLKLPAMYYVTDDIDSAKATWLHAVDSPYVAGPTTLDGRFEITALPPGTYTVEAWHQAFALDMPDEEADRPWYVHRPPIVLTREITVEPGKDIDIDFTFPVD
ncbi:MAG: carboxypeptidase regulatory-like domain-containing protein [Planctomycetes bacterium]|nr:carboxypeptidase regulatory-like domain-containing protein [Planctomycetota bacterium]